VPISIIFVIWGNKVPKKYVNSKLDQTLMCCMVLNEEASYKDLNPAYYLFKKAGSAEINPDDPIFNNMANSSFFL